MQIGVIIPAAGTGRRFGADAGPGKIEQDLAGRPVFLRSVELFLNRPQVCAILLAVAPDAVEAFRFRHGDKLAFHGVKVVPGGTVERWETVLKALDALPGECTHVAVHDAARPLAGPALIDRVFEAAERFAAVIPALPVSATLKRVVEVADEAAGADPIDAILGPSSAQVARRVTATVDRRDLHAAQTPQVFEADLLRRAYARIADARIDPTTVTDDAGLVEALGEPVHVVDGESANFKITHPQDMQVAAGYLELVERSKAADLGKRRLFGDDDD